jgi:hypothetical protein
VGYRPLEVLHAAGRGMVEVVVTVTVLDCVVGVSVGMEIVLGA